MSQMSYVHRPAVKPLEHRTVIQLFDIRAKTHPERDAFVIYNQIGQRFHYTFKDMQQRSMTLAASFLRLGWKRGDRVALMIPSRVEFLLSYMALLRIGANVLLLPSSGKPIDEVLTVLDQCQGLVFWENVSASFNKTLGAFLNKKFDPTKVVLIDVEPERSHFEEFKGYNKFTGLLKSDENLIALDEVLKNQDNVQFDDPAVVVFTSGSTGVPKGVQHTHHSLVNGAILSAKFSFEFEMDGSGNSQSRLFNDRPFYWSGCLFGGVNIVLSTGCTLIATAPMKSVKECDVGFLLRVLQKEKCTNALFMAYIVYDLVTHHETPSFDLSRLKTVVISGQTLPDTLFEELALILPYCKLIDGYGLTEALPIAFEEISSRTSSKDDIAGMDGVPPIEIKIIDENQFLLPIEYVGEICVRSPNCFLGYLGNDKETSKVVSSTGWVHTGDIGVMTHNGKIQIKGRNSEIITRASVKIFPAEVEKVLINHPDVKDVAVVGVPEVRLHEELCACVIPKDDCILKNSLSEFVEWMSRQWTVDEQGLSLKPKHFLLMEEFPITKTGKTDKKALRAIAAEKLGIKIFE